MQRLTASRLMALMAPILVLTIVQAAALAHGSPTEQQQHRASRLRRDVPDILLRTFFTMDVGSAGIPACDCQPARPVLHQIRRGCLARAAPTSLAKRFFDSLVRPVPINNGRRKRFLDSLVPPGQSTTASGRDSTTVWSGQARSSIGPLVEWPRGDLVRDGGLVPI
uniref:Secreted protein n=1 Tax=Macrostomum lignano TaxID=282301 RepID=A0A1I8FMJ7_9PLAT